MDAALAAAFEATWPPVETAAAGGFRVGRGAGAGGRCGSARLTGEWSPSDIALAEACHDRWRQPRLFRVMEDERALIASLQARGYRPETPTLVLEAKVGELAAVRPPPVTSFAIWPPLAIQRHIWDETGIDAARRSVMDRTPAPKAALLGRIRDRAAAAGFVAAAGIGSEQVAMLHALEVLPQFRRQGLAGWLVREAAIWAQGQGASRLALAVTEANAPARALYDSLGFVLAGRYLYLSAAD